MIDMLRWTTLRNHGGALGLLAAGLIVIILAAFTIKASVESAAQREFDFACNDIQLNINARLAAAVQILRSGTALFASTETVSREAWQTFAQKLQIEQYLPGTQGFGFALALPREQLASHIQEIRGQGFPDYQVRPAGERESYTAIIYLEPFSARNRRAFGYDMLSEPVRRAALEQARDEHTAALSGKVVLMQEDGQNVQAGTLLYLPVYRHGLPIATIEQRRAALHGWVYSPYRMTDLMRGILGNWEVKKDWNKPLSLQVYDGDKLSADTLLYDSQGGGKHALAAPAGGTRLIPLNFAGRRWTLRFIPPSGGLTSVTDYSSAWLVLIGGMIVNLLLFALLLRRQQSIQDLKAHVALATALCASEVRYRRLFEAARDGILILEAETGMVVDVNPFLVELLGVSREVFLGKKVWELGSFKDLAAHEANFVELQQKGYVRYEDLALEGSDGQRHEVEFISNVYLVNGRKVIQCNIRDISERKQAEAELAEAKALLQAALDHSQAGIAIADAPSGQLRYANQAALLIGGASKAELVAGVDVNRYVAAWKLLNLEGKPLLTEEVPLARAVLLGEPCTREFIISRPAGDSRIVLANAAPIRNPAGEVTAGIVVFLDITEQKRGEERLRQKTEELRASNEELTRFNRLMVSRELRAIELKQQVNDLAAQLGQARPYPLAFLDAAAAEVVRTAPKPGAQDARILESPKGTAP